MQSPASPTSLPITPRQRDCLLAIRELSVTGVGPSIDELARRLGVASKSTVHSLLSGLRDRGHVVWQPGRCRSLHLTGA